MSEVTTSIGAGSAASRPPDRILAGHAEGVRDGSRIRESTSSPRAGKPPGKGTNSPAIGSQPHQHDRRLAPVDTATRLSDRVPFRSALIRLLGLVSAALLGAVAVALAAPPLAAHADSVLVASSPAGGSQVSQPVSTVQLTFSAPITATSTAVTLAIDGATPRPLTATAQREKLIATIPADVIAVAPTAPQPWTIAYRAVSEDGHPINDQLTFTVTPTRPGASTPATSTPDPPHPTATARSTSSPSASGLSGQRPHDNGVDPHGRVGPERLLGPGLAVGLIAIAAFLVVLGPRLRRRPTPTADTQLDDTNDGDGDGTNAGDRAEAPDPAAPAEPG